MFIYIYIHIQIYVCLCIYDCINCPYIQRFQSNEYTQLFPISPYKELCSIPSRYCLVGNAYYYEN